MILFAKFLSALLVILFWAGFLSIIVVAAVIDHGGNPGLGQAIAVTAFALGAVLSFGFMFIGHQQRREVKQHEMAAARAREAPPRTFGAQESETYGHDIQTVWALIRPAESAVLTGNALRAFTVPGTPSGIGEQQCFIQSDGSVSILEIVGEEAPHWATTRVVTPSESDIRQTYQLEPTSTGCFLKIGIALEARTTDEWFTEYEQLWRANIRQYLTRLAKILALQHAVDASRKWADGPDTQKGWV